METEIIKTAVTPAAFLLPIVGAILVVPMSKISARARSWTLTVICLATVGVSATFVPGVLDNAVYETELLQLTPRIWMFFRVDAMGLLFGLTASVLWLLATVYSFGYMADEHRQPRYYTFLMLCLAWTMGVAFAGNLLTFLIFYELFSILTYPLIVHEETPEAMAAGTKYIIYILIGGSLVLLAIVFTFFIANDQTLSATGLLTMDMAGKGQLIAIFACFVAGFGVKAAIVPLHGWVPDAHPAAPAPFSAVLSGVMVAAGSFGIMRVLFNVFGVELLKELGVATYLGYLAAFTVVFAAILAVNQDNLKRRLAYSTISQMGYVVLGASLLGEQALSGSLVHIANHAFMKGALFLCAGILIKRAGIHRVSEMPGIASRFPITMACFSIATLSMIGTPPLSGFTSKWYLGLGIMDVKQPLYLAVLLGGALLAALYLLPIVYTAYFKEAPVLASREPRDAEESDSGSSEPGGKRPWAEAPAVMLWPLIGAAGLTVLLGVGAALQGLPLSLARLAAALFIG